jgi:hypothetical protein
MESTLDWEFALFGDNYHSNIGIGQRLGVPFTRSLQESLDIMLPDGVLSISQDGTGLSAISGVVWDCGLLFADYLIYVGKSLHLETVLDLGCGTGICGLLVLQLLQPEHVLFTDRCITNSLVENLDKISNDVKSHHSFVSYNWGDMTMPSTMIRSWDMIICSDLLYDAKHHDSLLSLLHSLTFTQICIAYKKRHDESEMRFFASLSQWCELRVISVESIPKINLSATMTGGLYLILVTPRSAG